MAVQYGSSLDTLVSHFILPIARLLIKMQAAYGHIIEEQPWRRPHQTILLLLLLLKKFYIELSVKATIKFAAVFLLMIHVYAYLSSYLF